MDTSDSEGSFISADEDFDSDDETRRLSLTCNSSDEEDNAEGNESAKEPEFKDPQAKVESEVPKSVNLKQRPEFGIPPARVECWEHELQHALANNRKQCNPHVDDNQINNVTRKMDQVKIIDNKNNNTLEEKGTQEEHVLEENSNKTSIKNITDLDDGNVSIEEVKDKENTKKEAPIIKLDDSDGVKSGLVKVKDNENTKKKTPTKKLNDFDGKQGSLEEVKYKKNTVDVVGKTPLEKSEVKNLNMDKKCEGYVGSQCKLEEERKTDALEQISKSNYSKGEAACDNMKKSCDENAASKEDVWNQDDGWGWNEEEDDNTAKANTHADVKKEDNSNIKASSKQVEAEGEDMWGDDDWSTNAVTKQEPQEEDLWGDDDDWIDNTKQTSEAKPITKALDNLTDPASNENTWGGWGNWGISSVLSTAATITSSVSQGITTVLENGIGVPDPEELARLHKAELNSSPPPTTEPPAPLAFGLTNLVSGVSTITKLVESTSTKVISGGLDTLETIGKKTMEVLQENDPGLKKKRAFLKIDQDKPVLSQILREAKEKAEEENKEREKLHRTKKANYETIFDDHQGLVHLEALEMLSKQCEIKLQTIVCKTPADSMADLQETLDQVKELCELLNEDEDDAGGLEEIKGKIDAALEDIKIPISYKKLLDRWGVTEEWLLNLKVEESDENDIHQFAIETLAELTASSVEQYHKAGELLLVKEHRSTADEADSLVQLTTVLTSLISMAASKFSEKLNSRAAHLRSKDTVNSLITNVFLEAANSSRYIQDAFQLLIPVLQVGAV